METNKRLILKLSAVLISVLLFLTFFSNTIYSLNLPCVTVGFPSGGVIMRTARAEGTVDFKENIYLYAEASGRITLAVSESKMVSVGDSLFTIRSDVEDLRDRLLSETNRLEKLALDIEKAESSLRYQQEKLDNLTLGPVRVTEVPLPDTGRYDYEMTRLSSEIEKAEAEHKSALKLYEAGAVSHEALTDLTNKLDALNMEYRYNAEQKEKALREYEQAALKAEDDDKRILEDQLKAYETERQSIIRSMEDLRYQKEAYYLDENEARRVIDRLNGQIADGGVETVYAEYDGMIREIPAGVDNGAYIDRNRSVMLIGLTKDATAGYPYRTSVMFPESVDFVLAGDNIKLNIKSSRQYNLPGVVEKLGFENGRVRADIVFDAEAINGGEKVEAVAELVTPLMETVLPNSALRKDQDGDFILYTERIPNAIMGYSYYARRLPIHIIVQDERNAAIILYSDIFEPVIINSDRPVAHGDRIRLVNENVLDETR